MKAVHLSGKTTERVTSINMELTNYTGQLELCSNASTRVCSTGNVLPSTGRVTFIATCIHN